MIFEVVVPLDIIIDEERLKRIQRKSDESVSISLQRRGQWWDEQMKLILLKDYDLKLPTSMKTQDKYIIVLLDIGILLLIAIIVILIK